jgi:predicted patatin/cPLA2 family phospholipase
MDITKLDTLVFSGGGIRGLSFVGSLMAFEDTYGKSASQHFTRFIGTSVGSLFALACTIQADVQNILATFEQIGIDTIFDRDVTWLLSNFALNDGEALRKLIVAILESKSFPASITFGDLYQKTQKTLIVTAVDLMTASVMYLDHTNEGHDMPVLKAIMGSMALPPIFPPIQHGPFVLSDGGLLDNFSVAKGEPETTLGIRTTWYIDPQNPTIDISAYYTRVLSILQLTMHTIQNTVAAEYPHVVCIDLGHIKPQETSIDMKALIFKGYRASIVRFSHGEKYANDPSTQQDSPTRFFKDDTNDKIGYPAYLIKLRNYILKSSRNT